VLNFYKLKHIICSRILNYLKQSRCWPNCGRSRTLVTM